MTIASKQDFTEECVQWALYCGVFAHYLVAVAQLRSGIKDDADADAIGPFRLKQPVWDAFRSDADFEISLAPTDITSWRRQCLVAAIMTNRAQGRFADANGSNPSAVDLYLEEFRPGDSATLLRDLQSALDGTADLVRSASAEFNSSPAIISDPTKTPDPGNFGSLNTRAIPAGRLPIAKKILTAFSAAPLATQHGFGALANAIAESNLDPGAHAVVGEDSCGLFQLNRDGGLGKGHTRDELFDPDQNIQITLREALQKQEFRLATTVEQAVSAFVRSVEKPKDKQGQIAIRVAIANKLRRG
jgi:hypothetical protein